MKTFNKILILAVIALTVSISSCKDDDVIPAVEFDFSSPIVHSQYSLGDTVHIMGMISWESELHGYNLSIKNETKDSVVFTKHGHEDGNMIHVHAMWVNDVDGHSDMSLTIDALTNHDGAKETKVIHFHCHPM